MYVMRKILNQLFGNLKCLFIASIIKQRKIFVHMRALISRWVIHFQLGCFSKELINTLKRMLESHVCDNLTQNRRSLFFFLFPFFPPLLMKDISQEYAFPKIIENLKRHQNDLFTVFLSQTLPRDESRILFYEN